MKPEDLKKLKFDQMMRTSHISEEIPVEQGLLMMLDEARYELEKTLEIQEKKDEVVAILTKMIKDLREDPPEFLVTFQTEVFPEELYRLLMTQLAYRAISSEKYFDGIKPEEA